MNQSYIINIWNSFASKNQGSIAAAQVYWANNSARHWSLPWRGDPVDPNRQYVWLHRTPNHCRIVFTIADGAQLNTMSKGMLDANAINTDYRQAYLEY